jgi:ferredoxin
VLERAFRELHRAAPVKTAAVPLPAGAPFGGIALDTDACTLCLACVAACPPHAITDNPDRPTLRFTESLCVQCGLCAATCPEDAITLVSRLDLEAWDQPNVVLIEEEPFACIACGKPFGTRSSIERVTERLSGHWMFEGPEGETRRRLLEMCEDCRVQAVVRQGFDPHERT